MSSVTGVVAHTRLIASAVCPHEGVVPARAIGKTEREETLSGYCRYSHCTSRTCDEPGCVIGATGGVTLGARTSRLLTSKRSACSRRPFRDRSWLPSLELGAQGMGGAHARFVFSKRLTDPTLTECEFRRFTHPEFLIGDKHGSDWSERSLTSAALRQCRTTRRRERQSGWVRERSPLCINRSTHQICPQRS